MSNPIFIYLDQYHWIDLGKAYHKRDRGKYLDLLNKVQIATQNGRVVFPFSIFHVVEALTEEDVSRRKRFAQVILEISQGWIIVPPWQVVLQELELLVEGVSNRQPQVFKKHPSLNSVDSLFTIYGEEANQESLEKYKAMTDDYSTKIEKARISQDGKAYSRETLRYFYARNLISSLMPELTRLSAKYDKSPEELVDLFGMFENVPTLDVQLELCTARERNLAAKVEPNDMVDISFLSVAIPYCDIVTADKRWFNYAKAHLHLDDKYSTRIFRKLEDLKSYLS